MPTSNPIADGARSEIPTDSRVQPIPGGHGLSRVWALAAILAVEVIPISTAQHPWFRAKIAGMTAIFLFVAVLIFGRDKLRAVDWASRPINRWLLLLHACALAVLVAANVYLLSIAPLSMAHAGSGRFLAGECVYYAALVLIPLTLAAALFPLRKLLTALLNMGSAWGLAAGCGLLVLSARTVLVYAWNEPDSRFGREMQMLTFEGVHRVLVLFYSSLVVDPEDVVLGTSRFMVTIAGKCSGVEGMALMLGLTVGWLIFSRRELRMARAVLLVPASILTVFLLNMVRIAALIALGDAGYGTVALSGFHSEAGWIFFSAVALVFLALVNRVAWFQQAGVGVGVAAGAVHAKVRNPAAIYLLPYLALVAASLLSQASSAGFEWLYGIRVLIVAFAATCYWRQYRAMDWSFSWLAPLAGVGIAAAWIEWARWIHRADAANPMAAGLLGLTPGQRFAWLGLRVVAAVCVIPFAEELAFRGFLARRLTSADVEGLSLQRMSVLGVVGSSLLYGLMQGPMWAVGIPSGMVLCLVARWRGRLGDAVAAHATANLLVAVWVLTLHDYSPW